MADQDAPVQVKRAPTPGVGGAISDAISALRDAFAPKAMTQRGKALDKGIADNDGSNPQKPDLGSQF